MKRSLAATIGEIARRYGYANHRVEYVVKSRRIEPLCYAGNARVFDEAAVQRIATELKRIDSDRGAEAGR